MAIVPGHRPAVQTPFTAGPDRRSGARSYCVPFVVAVTGHRDLVPDELPVLRSRVRDCLVSLRCEYSSRMVVVMSSLADGADRLVAEEAVKLGMPLSVVLPMPRALYEEDFTEESRAQFAQLCDVASEIFELPLLPGSTDRSLVEQGPDRARQYAQLGVFLSAHCHVLLAIWDGKENELPGGTAATVRFHHHDVMPGYASRPGSSTLTLSEDESDLVYHVVCSRDCEGGEPAAGLKPFDTAWFTTDEANPRTADIPARHRKVFEYTNESSREAQAHAAAIDRERYSLLDGEQAASLPPGAWDINQAFCAADWLAIRYQKRVVGTLKAGHVAAFFTAVAYLTYTDLASTPEIIGAIILLMLFVVTINAMAVRGSWQRKYLDYRTLAEGLRVQFYWATAGVTSGSASKFAHDNFLQMQDTELGWIRNVMRVAGMECDVAPHLAPRGVEFAVAEWIGDDRCGQLGYYRTKTAQRILAREATQRIGRLGIWTTIIALTALLFSGSQLPEAMQTPVVYLMGVVLLMVGVRQSYAKSTAEAELIKQYEFMSRIFRNARKRIDAAGDDAERRNILKVLGDAALEEHAQWILIHRERSIDEKEGLKLA